jgi:hypothetical protein
MPGDDVLSDVPDSLLVCYCTKLTLAELRAACGRGDWPPAGKERTGKLCTGCLGDLNYLLRRLAVER